MIHGVYDRLTLVGKVPHDAIDELMKVFQTTSVNKFNQLSLTLSYNKDLGLFNPKLLTVSKLIKLAKTKYQDLLVAGEWTRSGSSGPAFVAIHKKKGGPRAHLGEASKTRRYPNPRAIGGMDAVPFEDNGKGECAPLLPHKGKTCWNCGRKDRISSCCPVPGGRERPGFPQDRSHRGTADPSGRF